MTSVTSATQSGMVTRWVGDCSVTSAAQLSVVTRWMGD